MAGPSERSPLTLISNHSFSSGSCRNPPETLTKPLRMPQRRRMQFFERRPNRSLPITWIYRSASEAKLLAFLRSCIICRAGWLPLIFLRTASRRSLTRSTNWNALSWRLPACSGPMDNSGPTSFASETNCNSKPTQLPKRLRISRVASIR